MAKVKFDIKSEATRPFYATVGATDLAVEVARQYAAEVQAKVADVQKKVQASTSSPRTSTSRPRPWCRPASRT